MNVYYLCAPVSAPTPDGIKANLERAVAWLRYLRNAWPTRTVIAPWLVPLLTGIDDDTDPESRARGLVDCERVAARCDGVVLVGGRVSVGMERERAACVAAGGVVIDLTPLGAEPPKVIG